MSFRKTRTRRDANEPEIRKAIDRIGGVTWPLDRPVDLIVAFRGWNILMEVKSEKGKITTKTQKEFWETPWPGPRVIVRSAAEAVDFLLRLPEIQHEYEMPEL